MEERYITDYEKVRYIGKDGQRVVWSTQKGQKIYIEEMGTVHLISAWNYTNKKNPMEEKLTYLAQEIKFRGLEDRIKND